MPVARQNVRTRSLTAGERRLMVSAYLRKRFGPQETPQSGATTTAANHIAAGYLHKRQGAAATLQGAT